MSKVMSSWITRALWCAPIILAAAFGAKHLIAMSDPDWNKRGFIGCRNGVPTIANIDIEAINIPDGKFLIDATAIVCSGRDI